MSTPFHLGRKLKVLMLVNGFPTIENPSNNVFNFRAAKALNELVDLRVIHLRVWRPGRKFDELVPYEGIQRRILAFPMGIMTGVKPLDNTITAWDVYVTHILGQRWAREWISECDLIHSVCVSYSGIVGGHWANRFRKHHVTQAIGKDIHSEMKEMKSWRTIRGWNKNLQGVSCNSQALVDDFLLTYPGTPNVKAIYRGVDSNHYRPDGERAGPLSEIPNPIRYLFVGGLANFAGGFGTNKKGGETLMAAWKLAEDKPELQNSTLLFAGPKVDSNRVEEWRKELKYPDRVYIGGLIAPSDMPKIMRSADVLLLPSLVEGTPNVALEASASGCAVFGSDVGGTPEIVAHGETGIILPPGDVQAWSKVLIEYSNKPERISEMGKAARERMVAKFDKKHFATNILSLYETAMQIPFEG